MPLPRTAITVATALYDERDEQTGLLRDLEMHEQAFLTEVHRIGTDCARTIGAAARTFGGESKVTLAVRFDAEQRRDELYAAALERYDAAVAALDEVEEIEAEQSLEVA